MLRFVKLIAFTVLISLLYSTRAIAQDNSFRGLSNSEGGDDSLINYYLSDTAHAAQHITQLTNEAESEKRLGDKNNSDVIKKFQLALSLEPFAQDSPIVLSKLHTRFASMLFNAGASDLAVQFTKSSLVYLKKADPRPSTDAYHQTGKIASYYMVEGQYDSALLYFTRALAEANGITTSRHTWVSAAYNNLGILYQTMGEKQKALLYYGQALDVLKMQSTVDSALFSSITDNIGLTQMELGRYSEALALFKKNVAWSGNADWANDGFKTRERMARVFMAMNNLHDAGLYIDTLDALYRQPGFKVAKKALLEYWEIKKQHALRMGKPGVALAAEELIAAMKDSMGRVNRNFSGNVLQALTLSEIQHFRTDIQLNRLKLQQKETDLTTARNIARKNSYVTVLAVLFIILLVIYLINRGRFQQKQLQLARVEKDLVEKDLQYQNLEREKLEQELNYKKGDLSNLSIYISNLKDMQSGLLQRLGELKGTGSSTTQREQIGQMIKDMDAQILSTEKQNIVQENVDLVNKEFYTQLRKNFPDLTRSEMELCGLFKLNMSNKEIAALKSISAESVKMARYRLRKKLNLRPDDDIYHFLSEL